VEGKFNEFASDLVIAEIRVPPAHPLGTDIGTMLRSKGYYD
jgi:hypothetical protein